MSFLMNKKNRKISKKFGEFATRHDFSLFRATSCLETLESLRHSCHCLAFAHKNFSRMMTSIWFFSIAGWEVIQIFLVQRLVFTVVEWFSSFSLASSQTRGLYGSLLLNQANIMIYGYQPNDHYWALFSCSYFSLDWGQQTAETIFNFLFFFSFLDRSDFHHPHTISCQPATTTSWSSPIFKATSQCPCHRSSSHSTPIKSSRDAGIHQISHSCQLQLIKLQDCGRCRQFRSSRWKSSLHIFSRCEIIFLNKFV